MTEEGFECRDYIADDYIKTPMISELTVNEFKELIREIISEELSKVKLDYYNRPIPPFPLPIRWYESEPKHDTNQPYC